jgi:hypothetical protein
VSHYLHRLGDGEPVYFVDTEGGSDAMIYAAGGVYVGYISSDGGGVYSPDGQLMWRISFPGV